MNDNNIVALPIFVGLGAKESQVRLSTNQSAWKKELESNINQNSTKKNLDLEKQDGKENNKFSFSDEIFIVHKEISRFYNSDLHPLSSFLNFNSSATLRNSINFTKNKVNELQAINKKSDVPPATIINLQKNEQIFSIKLTINKDLSRSAKSVFNSPSFEIKPFNVKLLASGELIVRDYRKGLLQNTSIDDIVKDIRRILDRDIHKLRINGDLVWESYTVSSNNEHIIDLIY